MQVIVEYDLENALQKFKKMIQRDGVFAAISRRLEPKPSVRKRDKRRAALRRRLKKSQGRQSQEGNQRNDTVNCQWRFIYTGGEYLKVRAKRGELHQHE